MNRGCLVHKSKRHVELTSFVSMHRPSLVRTPFPFQEGSRQPLEASSDTFIVLQNLSNAVHSLFSLLPDSTEMSQVFIDIHLHMMHGCQPQSPDNRSYHSRGNVPKG
jgi:hypothetical protein